MLFFAISVALIQAPLQSPSTPSPTERSGQLLPSAADDVLLDDIVVEGRDRVEASREFVDVIARAPAGAKLARWNTPVCVSVVGLQRMVAEAVIGRVAAVAADVGVPTGGSRCRPNVVIIATADGRDMAQAVVSRERARFRIGIGNSDLGLAALERFRTSTAPVRWWHTSAPVNVDTGALAARRRGGPPPGAAALAAGGAGSPTALRNGSRLRSAVRHDLNSVTVIVDMTRVEGVSLVALADYIALVALAQIDPDADTQGQSTVLNLIDDREGTSGLTDWDMDYLSALYDAREDRANASAQEAEVATGLIRGRRERAISDGESQPD